LKTRCKPLPAFIGFNGTPLFKHDELTRRIFGGYCSRYDFNRSVEDQSTVRLVYESRGEKRGIARLDLNDRIAAAVEKADLDPDQVGLLERLLGKELDPHSGPDGLPRAAVSGSAVQIAARAKASGCDRLPGNQGGPSGAQTGGICTVRSS